MTFYGRPLENVDGSVDTTHSRIADPTNLSLIFSWFIRQSHDDKGNAMLYEYVRENSAGVGLAAAHERNRRDNNDPKRSANLSLKSIAVPARHRFGAF
jgi:hypothetical protein